jgi:hypothetical protein
MSKYILIIISELRETQLNIIDIDLNPSIIEYDSKDNRNAIFEAFERFESQYQKFINESDNPAYKFLYSEIKFREKFLPNKRFCSYCLIKKVKID